MVVGMGIGSSEEFEGNFSLDMEEVFHDFGRLRTKERVKYKGSIYIREEITFSNNNKIQQTN